MKRWLTLAVTVAVAAACQDQTSAVAPEIQSSRASLIGGGGAKLDPVLQNALRLAGPTDRIEVIVTFDEALTTGGAVAGALLGSGAGVVPFKHLPMVAAVATPAQIGAVSALPGVRSVYANRQLKYFLRESVASIRADEVHAGGYTGKGVGIAILDSGIDGTHPGLAYPTKTVANVKYLGRLEDLVTFDQGTPRPAADLFLQDVAVSETSVGHGTHVAGIAAGSGEGSAAGIYKGVAPGAHLVGIGAGDVLFVFWTLAGFDWILENRAKYNIQVVNNSWGTEGAYDPDNPDVVAAKKVYEAGIAVVFAAGNSGPDQNTMGIESVAPWVIAVGAGCKTTPVDMTGSTVECNDGRSRLLSDFSSRGIPGDPLVHPDIIAPGSLIVSARAVTGAVMNGLDALSDLQDCNVSTTHMQHHTCSSGTSMSAPHVSGVIALMEEASGGRLTPAQAYSLLTRTARPMPGYAEWEVGAGYLDAAAAVKAARNLRR